MSDGLKIRRADIQVEEYQDCHRVRCPETTGHRL